MAWAKGPALQKLLQRRLKIHELPGDAPDFRKLPSGHPKNQTSGDVNASIKIHRPQKSFESIHKECLLSPAAGLFLSFSEMKVPSEPKLFGVLDKIGRADEETFQSGQFAFGKIGVPAEK
jgi:hypothetical protein